MGMMTAPIATALASLLCEREFDVAHISPGALAGLAPTLEPLPSVLAALDAWHLNSDAQARMASPLRRPFYQLEARNVRRYISRAFRPFRRVVMVSDEDARALLELDPTLAVDVVPNGVDTQYLAPSPAVEPEEGLIVFTGAMQWAPNAEAARFLATEVLPLLRSRRRRVRLAIVGRNPGPEIRGLAAIEEVEVTGEVPDIRHWLWRAQAFVCPMISGTGIKNKLLEALACGTPCVATPLSCQGIRVSPGRDLLVADSATDLAAAVSRLLDDEDLRSELGRHGREAVVAGHGWDSVAYAYEKIYELAVAEKAPEVF